MPSDIVGAGCFADDLRLHLPKDLRPIVAEDMAREDVKLKQHIEKARLNDWFGGIVEAAKANVAAERMASGTEHSRFSEMAKTLEKSLTLTNGHKRIDEEGDVPMA